MAVHGSGPVAKGVPDCNWAAARGSLRAEGNLEKRRAMRFEGVITTWNDDRGFGFIEPERGGEPVFVHVKAFARGAGRPRLQQRVTFEVEVGPQGKKRACNVQPYRAPRAGAQSRHEAPAQWSLGALVVIPAFVALYALVAWAWRPPFWPWLALVYVVMSVVALFVYAFDKTKARAGAWRTSEQTLLLLAVLGGWPGALLAQQWLRHKSSKAAFRTAFWTAVAFNVAALLLLASPIARSWFAPGSPLR